MKKAKKQTKKVDKPAHPRKCPLDSYNAVLAVLKNVNPEAWMADGMHEAVIGVAYGKEVPIAVYDYDKCIKIMMERDMGLTYDEAVEFFAYNTLRGAQHMGVNAPVFVKMFP